METKNRTSNEIANSSFNARGNELTPKQAMFVAGYIKDFNLTGSARSAGYSRKTARQISFQDLTKLHILMAITKEINKCRERLQIVQDYDLKDFIENKERAKKAIPNRNCQDSFICTNL